MTKVSQAIREAVTLRAQGFCEYCQAAEENLVQMEVDHILPLKKGGHNDFDNLCLACRSCNSHKYDFIVGLDIETGTMQPLFNPRQDVWDEHFAWSEDGLTVIGLTPVGRATIARLQMNHWRMVRSRRRWIGVGWHPPKR